MKELHSLSETGALTKQEFLDQKVSILDHFKDLTPSAKEGLKTFTVFSSHSHETELGTYTTSI